jgi:cytochrome c-type biogenesis protein CcmH/NrfF
VRRILPLVAVAAIVVIAAATGLSAARGPNPNAVPTARSVDERTMSPFCVGLTLAACPSSEAAQLRTTIASMVASGRTNQEIDSFLMANYPKTVIGAPRSVVAWAVPAMAVLAGLVVVAALAFRRTRIPDGARGEELLPALPAGDGARLAADLERFARESSE